VAEENPDYLVVALDPVNFEKPYTKKLEGVSTVRTPALVRLKPHGARESTPPDLEGEARLAHGYPAMTATVVNTAVPALSYLNWFSYKTADFLSENREIQRSIRTTRWVFPDRKLRFVTERSGGDDDGQHARDPKDQAWHDADSFDELDETIAQEGWTARIPIAIVESVNQLQDATWEERDQHHR